jgi:signal transduction histidine kinase
MSAPACPDCQDLEREIAELARGLSHDLRAPLRAMEAFATLLDQHDAGRLDATGREYLRHIREGAREAAGQVDALTRLALVAVAPLRPAPVALDVLAREVLTGLAPSPAITLVVQDELQAFGDPHLLRRLLECLLDNALRFTPPGGRIEVGGRQEGAATCFVVRDSGPGFDMREVDHLFQPFARVRPRRPGERPGIGLAIARRIVERHGGAITARSAPGQGATFTFTLGPAQIPASKPPST